MAAPSFDELLKDIPEEKLRQPCHDYHLNELALFITEWQSMAPFLGLTDSEEEEIAEDSRPLKRKKVAMLRKWKEKFGHEATYLKLANVFWKLKLIDLIEKLCELLSDSCASSLDDKPSAIKSYAEYLKCRYKKQNLTSLTLQWPPKPTCKVFNLAMIKNEPIQYGTVDKEHAKLMLQGKVSNVLHRSVAVKLEDILKIETQKRKIILIEGAPGSGKSTLASEICRKWSSGELFHEMEVVIFVELRDPAVQAAKCVEDLIPAESRSKAELVGKELQKAMGQNMLWVLDGWDEFSECNCPFQPAVDQLVKQPQYLNMHCSTIIITSRPVSTADLQRLASSRIEILGFTELEVKQYFEETLKSSEMVQKLREQLKERPVIQASCYLPLNAAIVMHLFKAHSHTLPRTVHGVFESLVCCCLTRHVQRQSEELQASPVSSLDDLPVDLQIPFNNICKLAFSGIQDNKITFTREDLQSVGLPQELHTLSLIQGIETFLPLKTSMTYNFLHLSIQELLAAFHISKLPQIDRVEIFRKLFGQPRFAAVFRFYAAFTKLATEGIREIVSNILIKETQRTHEDKPQLVYLLHVLYETQDLSLYRFVAPLLGGGIDVRSNVLSPIDCVSLGYCLSRIRFITSGKFKVCLEHCSLDDYKISLLVRELTENPLPCLVETDIDSFSRVGIIDMKLGGNSIHGGGVRSLSELIPCNVMCKLDFFSGSGNQIQVGEDGLGHLSQALTVNCYSSIVDLNLCYCSLEITHENGPGFCHMLQANKTLKFLKLSGNTGVCDVGVQYVAKGLMTNSTLNTLHLQQCAITPDGAQTLSNTLKIHCFLEELNLGMNPIADDGVVHIANSLRQNSTLKRLYLYQCDFSDKASQLLFTDCLMKNRSILNLDVSGNQILNTSDGCNYVAHSLQHNRTLKLLGLNGCGLSDQGIPSLATALEMNTTLEVLSLGWDPFTDAGLAVLGQSLSKNIGLAGFIIEQMNSDNVMITEKGLMYFIRCLQENYQLTKLGVVNIFTINAALLQQEVDVVNNVRNRKKMAELRLITNKSTFHSTHPWACDLET